MLYEDSSTMFYSIIWGLVVLKQVIFVHPDFLILMTQVCACVLWCIIKIVRDNTGFPPILGLPQA